jgi:UDP-glucose 4-epimerase
MSRVLVTGGAGFIGSHLAERLVELGHQVTIYDNLCHGFLENIESIKDKVIFIKEDLENFLSLEEAVKNKEYIFHLAANTSINLSLKKPYWSFQQNVDITVKLLELANKHNVKRFIFSSSAGVYGDNDNLPLAELETMNPSSPYGVEKAVCEYYVKLFSDIYKVDTVSLRYFNVFGPRQNADLPHPGGVTIIVRQILENGRSELMGDGKQTRDMIYVDNIVEANILAMQKEEALKGIVYNVCTGKSIYIDKMHDQVSELMGKEKERSFIPFPDGNIMESKGDNSVIKKDLGFKIKVSLEDGLRKTVKWGIKKYSE